MREIKFRAWDKEKEIMLPVTLMDFNEWWVSCEPVISSCKQALEYGERNSFKNSDTDRHILMQYTGLKDKNGKEIYEGDYLFDGVQTWIVEYSRTYSGFHARDIHASSFNIFSLYHLCNRHNDKREVEVIGNIYSNPELLPKE